MWYFGGAPLELPPEDLGMVHFFSSAASHALIVPSSLVFALARLLYDSWERESDGLAAEL
jgi:hypothetical protein